MVFKLLGSLCICTIFTVFAKSVNNIEDVACGYDACPVYDPDALNVHLVPHSHDDVGWLRTFDQYYFEDVLYILSSVVPALKDNPERRYIQVETAFFAKWWEQQNDAMKQDVQNLINNGQLEIIGAGWSMNDEGAVHYQSTIDQFTFGMRYIEDNLGKCGRPRVGWQIDPFGHSREQASIFAQLGFDSFFFTRFDFRDKEARRKAKTTDMLWRGSASLGNTSDIFTSIIHNHYSAPSGFCFDIVCQDEPIIDDEESPDYNYQRRVEQFADYARSQASVYPSNNILVTMGDDFRYTSAITTYINLDLLIKGFELFPQTFEDKPIKVYYSTPSCYTKGVHEYVTKNNLHLDMKTDDFFPFTENPDNYFVGYFISRPTAKRFERQSSNLLQVVKQIGAVSGVAYNNADINELKSALGVLQHHDAITGTEMQHVTNNYNLLMSKGVDRTNIVVDTSLTSLLMDGLDSPLLGFNSCIRTNISYCPQTKSNDFTLVVYNPLSRVVSVPVTIPVEFDNYNVIDYLGNEAEYQLAPSVFDFNYIDDAEPSPNTLTFVAEELPPMGALVYKLSTTDTNESKAQPKILESLRAGEQIGYENTSLKIDETTGLLKTINMNGVSLDVTQELLYYLSKDGSTSYVFNPAGEDLHQITPDSVVKTSRISGEIYEAVVQEFGDWAKQIIKIYKHDQSFIEIDWLVGPLDVSDGFGKEVVSKFTTSLETDATWYTDANGRELIQRVRNHRPTFNYTDERHAPGNYYPVNTRIVLRDESKGVELAVLTDRSEGGSSLQDGNMEIMLHRALVALDFGTEPLQEEQYGQGVVARGQHYIVLGPLSGNGEKSLAAIERELALRQSLAPWYFFSDQEAAKNLSRFKLELLTNPLPDNVNILSFESWSPESVLIRLEHILAKDDDINLSQEVVVDLTDAFTSFDITEMVEMTLGANSKLEESARFEWPGSSSPEDEAGILNINERLKRDPTDLRIALAPMQIRTFVAKYVPKSDPINK